MHKRLEKNFGITLIALIITIIILLLLAGVAIATLTGENGLFARAKQAKQAQIESEMKEQLNLSIQELQVEKLAEATLDDITQEWLTQKLSEYNPILKEDESADGKKVTLQKDGIIKTYLIDINLNITEIENENNIEFSYEIKSRNNGTRQILIKVRDSENGINKIECSNGNIIECFGTKQEKSIDYTIEVGMEYNFKIISTSGKEREETILIEPEIIVGEAYIGTSTTETDSTKSVADNSQTKGTTTLYINFTAILEKFGTECTVKLKDEEDTEVRPYVITRNGTYTFVVTGTYNGKTIEKEIEVKASKYISAGMLVQYDAGDWTEDEINELKKDKLYDINKEKNKGDGTFKLNSDSGLNFTFGGFTYKGDNENKSEINSGNIIISRNQSVMAQKGWGKPNYEGWQILESEEINGKTYIYKLIHAGSPENFVYYYNTKNDAYRAEYLLSGGKRNESYDTLSDGTLINFRKLDMYKDKELDKKGYIKDIHIMTYEEAYKITGTINSTNGIRNIGQYYRLASAKTANFLARVDKNGGILTNGNETLEGGKSVWGIRPVVVMSEGVYIASGDGTEANPYVLGKD